MLLQLRGKTHEFRVCHWSQRKNFCDPTEYGSLKISATTTEYRSRKISATTPPPPPNNPFGQNSVCPPKWMLARTPMPIHDTYRDTYRIIYSIKNIAETVIKNNIQTHYTCPTHFMQLEAGIEHVCNISATGTFRNSPWDLGQGNSLTILFSEDNLTCTMSRWGAVTLMIAVTKELVSDSAPSSYRCHCDPRCMSTSQTTLVSPHHLQLRLLETSTSFVLPLYRGFMKLFHSYRTQCVKAYSRHGKHGAGHFHRWNASRMRIY